MKLKTFGYNSVLISYGLLAILVFLPGSFVQSKNVQRLLHDQECIFKSRSSENMALPNLHPAALTLDLLLVAKVGDTTRI